MTEEYTLQPNPQVSESSPEEQRKTIPTKFYIIGGIIGVIVILTLGILLGVSLSGSTRQAAPTPTPTPTPLPNQGLLLTPTPFSEVPQLQFLPDKQYFDDTYVVIQKAAPYQTLILSVSRVELQRNYLEYTKVNYFDGKDWDRKAVTTTLLSADVATNSLLRLWNEKEIESQSTTQIATIMMPKGEISFTSSDLENEISIQSLPGSTKFIYQGVGKITTKEDTFDAYVFHSRTYSFNAADLDFLTQPEILTSNWLLFWDAENTFYYLDTHRVPNPSSPAQTLAMGIREDATRKVVRITDFSTMIDKDEKLSTFVTTYNSPVNEEVMMPLDKPLNKSNKKTYTWNLESGSGQAVKREGRVVQGIGVLEYIKQN